ncbi:hypothetical protein [Ponticaulis sp.]|uniref:hypothetical protein n=1 Tax=Ponticaulis sp. TaxID=2020902 RepID=UPI000C4AB23F|nr:hypothetical protein [Ponticaulis sp.]MAF57808.1 hypothetical protein [Ponticaulis sp.]MBN04525.1 hypothetical protein [Ponticaulis sp.]
MSDGKYAVNRQTGEVQRFNGQSWERIQSARNTQGDIQIYENDAWRPLQSASQPTQAQSSYTPPSGVMRGPGLDVSSASGNASQPGPRLTEEQFRNSPSPETVAANRASQELLDYEPSRAASAMLGVNNGLTGGLQTRLNAMIPNELTGQPSANYDERLQQARDVQQWHSETNPMSYGAGELTGFGIATAIPLGRAAKGVDAVVRSLPQAASRLNQAVRYGTRLAGLGALGAGENALYEGTVGASNREATEGRDVSLGERADMAVEGGTNPLAWAAGPALSLAGRSANRLFSGTFTPSHIATPDRNIQEIGEIIDASLVDGGATPDALGTLERALNRVGVPLDTNARRQIVVAVNEAAQSAEVGLPLAPRFKDAIINALDNGSGRVRNLIQGNLRAAYNASPDAAATIQRSLAQDLPAARQSIRQRFQSIMGDRDLIGAEDDILEELQRIGREGYEPILARGDAPSEGAEWMLGTLRNEQRFPAIQQVITGPGMDVLRSPLNKIAAGEGLDLAGMVARNPLRAAHWMQSRARMLEQGASEAADRGAYRSLRSRILNAIESEVPEYREVRQLYGDEYGALEAVDFGKEFMSAYTRPRDAENARRAFEAMSEPQQAVALLSARDELLRTMRGGRRINNPDGTRSGAAPRLTMTLQQDMQDAIERVFGERGKELVEAINDTDQFLQSRNSIDPSGGSQTDQMRLLGERLVDDAVPAWRNRLAGYLGGMAEAPISAPIRATLRGAQSRIQRDPSQAINEFTALMEAPLSRSPRNALQDMIPE